MVVSNVLTFNIFIDYCLLPDFYLFFGYFFGFLFVLYAYYVAWVENFFFNFINTITPITKANKPPPIPAINPIIHVLNYSYVYTFIYPKSSIITKYEVEQSRSWGKPFKVEITCC